ncbi:hypothetical protein M527_29180 [Sphingobium indicum IP26]|uniref:hypothetical protein n=1 Tax=Sphingobium sp. HDIP04 TaxID=428994 RepID=UPI00035ED26F|nr:hypothetical protein [Sphingobium sp. HDIP04]EPR14188.1 hypothetical protein M527_29180 [Sphingobium indicum IP26]EQB03671.1 hypothetical protein L286_11645 [Sphingobium sp. HDIP04]
MPTGLQITNASGFVQIDENYRNLALRHRGRVNALTKTYLGATFDPRPIDPPPILFPLYDYTLTVPNEPLVIATTPKNLSSGTSRYFKFQYQIVSGANKVIHFYGEDGLPNDAEYFIFGFTQPSAAQFLSIHDTSGNIAYSAGEKYMRVVRVATGAVSGSDINTNSKRYALAENNIGFAQFYEQLNDNSPPDWYTVRLGYYPSFSPGGAGTGVIGWSEAPTNPFQIVNTSPDDISRNPGFLVLDVTNF